MKYIISESRFDKMIDAYLDSQFEPHKIVNTIPHISNFNPIWVVNHEVVAEFMDNVLFVKKSILFSLISLFSLAPDKAIEKLKDYFNKKLNAGFDVAVHDMKYNQTYYDAWRGNNLL